ncbi:MAG TPA: hypothetical protein VHZ03_02465 [Trebonia sp.]|jgi:hypothetical protein|nr:hypothetical protein [Trebonia sp.]
MKEIILIRSALAVVPSTARRPTGTIIAPPAPWTTRQATSSPMLRLVEQSSDATVKITMAARALPRINHSSP